MAVLRDKMEDTTAVIRIRLPKDLASELDTVQAEAKKRGREFPVSEIVAKALRRAVKQAQAELSDSQKQREPV